MKILKLLPKFILSIFAVFCASNAIFGIKTAPEKASLPYNPFGNPLIPDLCADPSIIEVDGTFYCYVTTDGYGQGLETSGPPVMWKSKDFVNWSFDGTYFPQAEKEKYWAPSAPVKHNGKWYIYPTINGYMYPASSDSPDGPFSLAKGSDFTLKNRLWEKDSVCAIDAEAFIDDNGERYIVWGLRNFARMKDDMVTIDSIATVETRKKSYTEGPIFFKRKGIYYYLYTIMALEKYEYYYQISHESPLGPYITPEQDIVCTTDADAGVFGPGHGCVFNPAGTDDYYLVFLEFSRNSTDRQIYVGKLEFNDDGTIKPMKMSLNGIGALRPVKIKDKIKPISITASSETSPHEVPYKLDNRCRRTEYFVAGFAADESNGSRWMADSLDSEKWLCLDLGESKPIGESEIFFVRPTAGHTYRLEGSNDGKTWMQCGGSEEKRKMSPRRDTINKAFRYLRVKVTDGVPGVWEWNITKPETKVFEGASWIAMEKDSTLLFPYIHLLKANSEEAKSLKEYALPVFKKSVSINGKKLKKATANICGLGQYELFINGKKADGHFLSPGWTKYDRSLMYNTIDITELLKGKKNADLKVMLGNGMYNIPVKGYHKMAGSCGAPKMIFALDLEYADGTKDRIVSDQNWTVEESPIRFSSIYAGEWMDAGYKGDSKNAIVTAPAFDVPFVAQPEHTLIKTVCEYPSVKVDSITYDFGKNSSGIVRLKVIGEKGKSIILRPGEIMKDGKLSQRSQPGYQWKYTLSGDPDGEIWQPQFTYAGFRYVEVIPDDGVELLELTGLHTSTDVEETGSFECSDTLFNKIHSLIDQAIRSNMVSITTDCPTREKLGWQEQNHLMAHSIMYRYDVRELFNKIVNDLAESQHTDGAIPTIAPEYTVFEKDSGFEDTPEWGASFILLPWYIYRWYGDDSAMKKHYDNMKLYISYLGSRSKDNILDYGLGDWFDIGPAKPGKAQLTSVALSATAMYYYELLTMNKIASILGKNADAREFAALAEGVAKAFNDRFMTDAEKVFENGSQTGLSMALYTGLAEKGGVAKETYEALISDIEKRGYSLTSGDIGYRYLVRTLADNGGDEILYKMNHNDSLPSYAYQLKKGATALTESWQAYDEVSNNHLMLGHLMEWLYGGIGGIRQAEGSTGWDNVVIDPKMVGDITWANTSLKTPHGKVECKWQRSNDSKKWLLKITIPQNTTAQVHLPNGKIENVGPGSYKFHQ
ncbi:MAG: family 78 glycoside hydrolase catalytic domain [Muribaculaceae bacterium]|nr:family 78 glycoside hydrolase catalytic domain [Muribaculaceae bacterium]